MGNATRTRKPAAGPTFNRLPRLWSYRARTIQAWLVLLTCLAASGLATLEFFRREKAATELAFDARIKAIQQALNERMDSFGLLLRGAAGLFASGAPIGPDQWQAYFHALDFSRQFQGVLALGYIENVSGPGIGNFEEHVRANAHGHVEFRDFHVWPVFERDSRYVVRLVEPLDRNVAALGYDISSEPARRVAAEEARDRSEATYTRKVKLVQAPDREGMILLLPVYLAATPPPSLDERRAALQGWVYAAFLLENMMAGLVQIGGEEVGLEVYEGGRVSPDNLLYRDPANRKLAAAPYLASELSRDVEMVFGGRTWRIRFNALPAFHNQGRHWVPYSIAAGGVSISLLVFFIALSLLTSEKRALELSLQMTEKLRLHERAIASYRELVNNLSVGVYRTTPGDRGQFVEVNPALLAMTDAESREELLKHSVSEFYVNPGQRKEFSERLLRDGSVKSHELEMVTLKGRKFWGSLSATRVNDEEGRIFFDGVIEDVTDRKRAEQTLRETQERFALALQGTTDGIWDWNVLTDEVYYSPRWKAMLGYEEHEIENRFSAWEGLLHPDDRENALACVRAYLNNEIPTYELEHRLKHKNGSYRWILARGVAVRDSQGRPVRMAGSQLDLTERKEAEERLSRANHQLALSQASLHNALQHLRASHDELKSTQLQLIQAAKLESVGTLAAGVAHEVKNPLQTILWGIEYLDGTLSDADPKIGTALGDMRDAVQRANAIVRELLQLSAMTALQMKDENVNELLNRALWLSNYEAQASRIDVVKDLDPHLPAVPLDRGKMEQAFINVLLNSIQAMAQGGTLTVKTRVELKQPGAGTTNAAAQPHIVVEFTDTGPGIPPDILPRIFDPFFTTKPVGVGTGLGLPIVKKIVDLHQGGLSIRNEPVGGTTVIFTLRTKSPISRDGPNSSNGAHVAANGFTSVSVDDESENRGPPRLDAIDNAVPWCQETAPGSDPQQFETNSKGA